MDRLRSLARQIRSCGEGVAQQSCRDDPDHHGVEAGGQKQRLVLPEDVAQQSEGIDIPAHAMYLSSSSYLASVQASGEGAHLSVLNMRTSRKILPAVVKSGDSTNVMASEKGSSTRVTNEIQLGRMESRSTIG